MNQAEKTVAVETELVCRRCQFPEVLAVRTFSGKKCFSCVGEAFALDRRLLMGDPFYVPFYVLLLLTKASRFGKLP
jgi:hypothetical protein